MPHPFFHLSLKSWRSTVFLLLCVAVGFAGGIVGSTVRFDKEEPLQTLPTPVQQFPLILDPLPQEGQEQIPSLLLKKFESSIFEVWSIPENTKKGTREVSSKNTFLGYAIGVTSDGWLLTSIPIEKKENLHIFDRLKQEFLIQTRIDDSVLGVTYIKINDASIRPLQFAQNYLMSLGGYGYLINDHRLVQELFVSPPMYPLVSSFQDGVQTTSQIATRFNPTQSYSTPGSPVVTRRGELLGITHQKTGIIPGEYIKDSLDRLLRQGTAVRTSIAISYVDIRSIPFSLSSQPLMVRNEGATVVSDKKGTSIPGVDGQFILRNNDIITRVNSDTIDINRSLSELIHQYKKGDAITLTILRNDKELTQKIVLP